MAPAQVIPSSSHNGGKQKKVPQRGLGVAQLEKVRLEEEIKREAAKVLGNGDSISIGGAALQCPIQIQLNGPLQSISSSGNGGWCRFRFFHASPLLMEPPWNQNIHANNNYASSRPQEYKMVGVKRAYPFSLETRSFAHHFDPSRSRFQDSPSCTVQMEPRNIHMSSSTPRQVLKGDFLTMAPPSISKHNFPQGFEESRKSQVYASGQSRPREEAFSFFPVRSDIDDRDGNGGKGETIDLNLKL